MGFLWPVPLDPAVMQYLSVHLADTNAGLMSTVDNAGLTMGLSRRGWGGDNGLQEEGGRPGGQWFMGRGATPAGSVAPSQPA